MESVFSAEKVGRSVSKRRQELALNYRFPSLQLGHLEGGSITYTNKSVEAFTTERHSAGIELIILMRKNLCSGFTSEFIPYEKELFPRDQITYLNL